MSSNLATILPNNSSYTAHVVPLLLLVLCLQLCAVNSYKSQVLTNQCTFDNLPEELPTDLSSVAYLGLNDEFHFHGEFYANFSQHEHAIFFNLTKGAFIASLSQTLIFSFSFFPTDFFLFQQRALFVFLWRRRMTGTLICISSISLHPGLLPLRSHSLVRNK